MEEKKVYTVFLNDTPGKAKNRYATGAGLYYHDFSVQELAGEIISSYHPHLKEARIAYLLRPGKWKSKGRAITGRAVVATPLWRLLSGYDLVLILNETIYRGLDEKGKRALLDHELSHFAEPMENNFGEKGWSTREHDVQEFSFVVKRHGICFSNLKSLTGTAYQLDLQSLQEQNTAKGGFGYAGDEEENLFYEEVEE